MAEGIFRGKCVYLRKFVNDETMKRTVITLALVLAAFAATSRTAEAQGNRAQKPQDFNELYAKTEFAYKAGEKIYNSAVRPVWTSEDTFYFQAH